MYKFRGVAELLQKLANYKDILSKLYEYRSQNFTRDTVLTWLDYDEEKLSDLVKYGFIIRMDDYVTISEDLVEFFGKMTDTPDTITSGYVRDQIKVLRQNVEFYTATSDRFAKLNYLNSINRLIRKIGEDLLRNAKNIRKFVIETYETEPDFKIKKLKLNNLKQDNDNIDLLIKELESCLKSAHWQGFVKITYDRLLEYNLDWFQDIINKARDIQIDTNFRIVKYHNIFKRKSDTAEKVFELKRLKDKNLLKVQTNVLEILQENSAWLDFEQSFRISLLPDIDYLYEEQGTELVERVAKKKRLKNKLIYKLDKKLVTIVDAKPITYQAVNFLSLKEKFKAADAQLFDFILNDKALEEKNFVEKLSIFVKFVSKFFDELIITDEYKLYNDYYIAIVKNKKR